MTNVMTGKVQLLDCYDLLDCRDKRVRNACEYWFASIPEQRPFCLLCDQQWKDIKQALKQVGAFMVATIDLDPTTKMLYDCMVAGVCTPCTQKHGEATGERCYRVFCEAFSDTVTVHAPHPTVQ